jgi:antitoxin MazE
MKASIIIVGNSQGIIIPSTILKKLNIVSKAEVDISIDNDAIVIKPKPRMGWEESFALSTKTSNSEVDLFEGLDNKFDEEEWKW